MNRRPSHRGAIPPATSAFLPPLVRQRYPLYSYYSLARPMTARMAFPAMEQIDIFITSTATPCGNYIRVDDKTADALRKVYDQHQAEEKKPAAEPDSSVALQVQFAPQVVYHQAFHPSTMMPGAEVDPVLTAGVNFAFHKDHKAGFEFSVVLQGSFNYSFVDPNKNDPNEKPAGRRAWQGQLQLQGSYAFEYKGLAFNLLLQVAGALSYQYDPMARKNLVSPSGTVVGGLQIAKSFGKDDAWSIGGQATGGPSTNQTIDWTGTIFLQRKF